MLFRSELMLRVAKAVALLELIQDTDPTSEELVARCLAERMDGGNQQAAVRQALEPPERREQLLEVILDLGRVPEARYPDQAIPLGEQPVAREDLAAVLARLGPFGGDNRAGIERTLHRISAIRNRSGAVEIGRAHV